jgi:hypothetical protein
MEKSYSAKVSTLGGIVAGGTAFGKSLEPIGEYIVKPFTESSILPLANSIMNNPEANTLYKGAVTFLVPGIPLLVYSALAVGSALACVGLGMLAKNSLERVVGTTELSLSPKNT